ncbi:MAG: MGMT family protein [Anaerolineae bacterium]|nr:MGMT family protein [Anaerolineae bacterium]
MRRAAVNTTSSPGEPDERPAKLSFRDQIYLLVRAIPRGRVMTYVGVAGALGVPKGARAVGWALRLLPSPSDVPWHRVINSQGRISTRYFEGGELLQRALLEAEGVQFDETGRVQLDGPRGFRAKDADFLEVYEQLGLIR